MLKSHCVHRCIVLKRDVLDSMYIKFSVYSKIYEIKTLNYGIYKIIFIKYKNINAYLNLRLFRDLRKQLIFDMLLEPNFYGHKYMHTSRYIILVYTYL